LPRYQTVVSTLDDSDASGNHYFDFLVVAQTSDINQYYVSAIDSGYSVDNIPPIPPAGLLANVQSTLLIKLTWHDPTDPDVRSYSIYRSTSSGFTPAPENIIGTSSSTSFTDASPLQGVHSYYRIVAVDVHDNVSQPSPAAEASLTVTQLFSTRDKWNMVSVPLTMGDYDKTVLYPAAISSAFAYQGSYVTYGTLKNGTGYWMKFSGVQSIPFAGLLRNADTVDVNIGWNMIGSISTPLGVSSITSLPFGIVTTRFFAYTGSYQSADTIQPGSGYWVKVNQSGKLILSSAPVASEAARIRVTPTNERPPVPPDAAQNANDLMATSYTLEQNYPNPFNPTTTISYSLPVSEHVKLSVYNMLGEEVALLVDENQNAGHNSVSFDANGLPSGVYVYRISAGSFTNEKKLLFVK
jgi:hypothetical protein